MLRRLISYWTIAGIVLVLDAALALQALPHLVRAAHAGAGPALLRRILGGPPGSPLELALDVWDERARLQLAALAAALLVVYVGLRIRRSLRVAGAGDDPGARAPVLAPVVIGLWFGLLSGFGEGFFLAVKTGLIGGVVRQFYQANLATALVAPLSNALFFGAIGLGAAALGGRRHGYTPARAAAALLGGLTVAGWADVTGRTGLIPALVLGAGAGVQVWRWTSGRTTRFSAWVGPSVLRGLALFAGLAALYFIVPAVHSARVNARLAGDPGRPSVLWIVLDTERAKSLELYGRGRATSPALTRFAQGAVVFDNAIAPSSWTMPSHGSFFTGLPADSMGIHDMATPLRDSFRTIAEVLRERGYRTAGFGGNLIFLNPSFHLNQGFTDWSATPLTWQALGVSTTLGRRVTMAYRKLRGKHEYLIQTDARALNRRVQRWFERRRAGRPYFVFINYFDVHEPYEPRPGFLEAPVRRGQPDWLFKGWRRSDYFPAEAAALLQAYESEIGWLDAEIDRLLAWLGERGDLDHTLIIITSDHGEQFGEHGLMDHTNSLYRAILHVPLVIRFPDGGFAGTRVAEPVGLRNLGAFILDVAGLGSEPFPGRSFAPLVRGEGGAEPVHAGHADRQAVIADGYWLIRNFDGSQELYRLDDVAETQNLAASPEHADALRRLLALVPPRSAAPAGAGAAVDSTREAGR